MRPGRPRLAAATRAAGIAYTRLIPPLTVFRNVLTCRNANPLAATRKPFTRKETDMPAYVMAHVHATNFGQEIVEYLRSVDATMRAVRRTVPRPRRSGRRGRGDVERRPDHHRVPRPRLGARLVRVARPTWRFATCAPRTPPRTRSCSTACPPGTGRSPPRPRALRRLSCPAGAMVIRDRRPQRRLVHRPRSSSSVA